MTENLDTDVILVILVALAVPSRFSVLRCWTCEMQCASRILAALAISGFELIRMWYYDPTKLAIMQDCAHTEIGVWSDNALDRAVVVAVYGAPNS